MSFTLSGTVVLSQSADREAGAPALNLLTNGSFELGLGAEPFYPGWRISKTDFPHSDAPSLPTLDTTVAHGGSQSLKLSRAKGRGIAVLDLQCPTLPEKTSTYVSFWAKANRVGVKATVGICPADGKGRTLNAAANGNLTSEWQQFKCEVQSGTGFVPVRIEASSDQEEAFEVWIDDVYWATDKNSQRGRSGPVELVLLPESRNGIHDANSPVFLSWSADSDIERKVVLKLTLHDLTRRSQSSSNRTKKIALTAAPAQGKIRVGQLKRGAYLAELEARDPASGVLLGTGRERFTVMTNLQDRPAPVDFDAGYHGGIEFGQEMGFNWRGYWSLDEFFAINFQTGFRVQRDIWEWKNIQPTRDKFVWEGVDPRVEAASRNGCTTILCVPHSPLNLTREKYSEMLNNPAMDNGQWIYKTATDISNCSVRSAVMGGSKNPEERNVLMAPDPQALTSLMTEIAKRYDGKIAAIEFLNEANLFITPGGLIDYYFKPAYAAIKKAAPKLPVLMNSTMDYSADGNGYNGQFLALGGLDYTDGIMHHPYGVQLLKNNGLQGAKTLERLAAKHSRPDKKMILGMSEIHGIGDYAFLRGEPVQRALLDWSIGCRWSAGVLLAYTNFYEGIGPRKWLLRGPFAPGVGAVEMNALYSTLGGYRCTGRIELDDNVLICRFERPSAKPGESRYAVAITAAALPSKRYWLDLDLKGLKVAAFDPFGEPMALANGGQIPLSADTIYLQSADEGFFDRVQAGRVSWRLSLIDEVEVTTGPAAYISIHRTGLPPVKRDAIGIIHQWTMLDDVPNKSGDLSPEALGLLDAKGRLAWPEQKTRVVDNDLPYVALAEKAEALQPRYAYTILNTDKAMEVPFYLSSTGPVALWINGKAGPDLSNQQHELVGHSWRTFKLPLKAGINTLLVRVTSAVGPCAFALSANKDALNNASVGVDEEGFLHRWKLIGPWTNVRNSNGSFTGNTDLFPPENNLDPDGFYTGLKNMPLIWHEASFAEAVIPHPWSNAISYALATVEVPEDTHCLVALGSDDGYALWINGDLVGRRSISRAVKVDDEKLPVLLKKGRNQVLFKIEDIGGGGAFVLRFIHEDGRPVATKPVN